MTQLTCTDVHDAAAEYALDILEPEERSALAAHLLRCPTCREEVQALGTVATRLLELVPGTEPPLGFDRRVLARVRDTTPRQRRSPIRSFASRRPRLAGGIAAAVAAAALLFGSLGWFMGHSNHYTAPQAVILDGYFHQGGHTVGEVLAYRGSPVWVDMTVHGLKGDSRVTCELVDRNGTVTRLGSFDLVDGSGSWGAPDRIGVGDVSGARLVDRGGQVIATAVLET